MKLYFITSKLNFETAGGSVEEFDLMMRAWQRMGVDVTAVTAFSDANRIPHALPYPVKEEQIRATGRISVQRGIFEILKKYEQEADIFHVDGHFFMYGAGAYRRFGGRKPVQAYFNRELTCWPPLLSTLFPDARHAESLMEFLKRSMWWTLERFIGMPLANGIDTRMYVCPQFKQTYEAFGMSSKGMIFVDPVDTEMIKRDYHVTEETYAQRNKATGPITLFYSSRMVGGKGFDVLLEGFARVKNKEQFHLLLGGTGPEESCVKNAIARLKLEPYVTLLGWTTKEEVFQRYAEADIFIQPDWIPFGTSISLIQAMAFGIPCIVPGNGGLEWLAGKGAITFHRREPEDLARAIEKLGADAGLRLQLSRGCAERLASDDLNYDERLRAIYETMKTLTSSGTATPDRS